VWIASRTASLREKRRRRSISRPRFDVRQLALDACVVDVVAGSMLCSSIPVALAKMFGRRSRPRAESDFLEEDAVAAAADVDPPRQRVGLAFLVEA